MGEVQSTERSIAERGITLKTKALKSLIVLVCIGIVSICGTAWAMDEAVLTPTNSNVRSTEDKVFEAAMKVWYSHKYADGKKLLKEFAEKHPNNRWRAEAELHEGCYLTYLGQTADAKTIFQRLASEFVNTNIKTKARLRLANIAEREAKTDDAIAQYAAVLRANPTWDQFKYANYHARKLMMTRGKQEARINCG